MLWRRRAERPGLGYLCSERELLLFGRYSRQSPSRPVTRRVWDHRFLGMDSSQHGCPRDMLSPVQTLAVRAPTQGAEVRGVGRLVANPGEFNRVELLVAQNAGLEREVEDAAGQHGPLHRIRRLAGFEHHLDILDETAEV